MLSRLTTQNIFALPPPQHIEPSAGVEDDALRGAMRSEESPHLLLIRCGLFGKAGEFGADEVVFVREEEADPEVNRVPHGPAGEGVHGADGGLLGGAFVAAAGAEAFLGFGEGAPLARLHHDHGAAGAHKAGGGGEAFVHLMEGNMVEGKGVDDDVEGGRGEAEDAVGHGEEADVGGGDGGPGLCQGAFVRVNGHNPGGVARQVAGDAAGAAAHFEDLCAPQVTVAGDGADVLAGGVLVHGRPPFTHFTEKLRGRRWRRSKIYPIEPSPPDGKLMDHGGSHERSPRLPPLSGFLLELPPRPEIRRQEGRLPAPGAPYRCRSLPRHLAGTPD